MYFCLAKNIYAARYENDVIILDITNDRYYNITDASADIFQHILRTEFQEQDETYTQTDKELLTFEPAVLSNHIAHFTKQGFIIAVKEVQPRKLSSPLISGGLSGYRWDSKSSLAPFKRTSKVDIIKAYFMVRKVNRSLKHGMNEITQMIDSFNNNKTAYKIPSAQEIQGLSDAVDVACSIYGKKVFCLAWASTFVLLALKRGWKCDLVIAAQSIPFYGHAWAEIDGKVVNDSEDVQKHLSILLKTPFGL